MAVLRLVLVLALVSGCYSPKIEECTISCGAGGACPVGLSCLSDGFCHGNATPDCLTGGTPDAPIGIDGRRDGGPQPDGRIVDARPFMDGAVPDARTVDAATTPDARPMPDANPTGCTSSITFVEDGDTEDSVVSNLSLGADGHVHITYVDDATDVLRYAHRPKGATSWLFETVGPAADFLKGQTLDAQGGLHVVFSQSSPSPRLSYAYRPPGAGATWDLDVIDESALSIDGSVVVDGDGVVHVAYWYNLSDLNYAVRFQAGGDWFITPVDTPGVVGEHPSLAIDSEGALHVTYRVGGTSNDLGYGLLDPFLPFWVTAHLDQTNNVGAYTALALDSHDNVHVVYSDNANENLRYGLFPVTGTRRFGVADEKRAVGRFNSIDIDGSDRVHVSTFDYGQRDLRYGVKQANSNSFTFRTLDSAGEVGRHSSLAVSADGVVHIAYIDDTQGDLKYAIVCP
jgi:hypothetical protein